MKTNKKHLNPLCKKLKSTVNIANSNHRQRGKNNDNIQANFKQI